MSNKNQYRSEKKILKYNFIWNIDNFSSLTDVHISSAKFQTGIYGENVWKLQLYPNGNNDNYNDYVALYVLMVSSSKEFVSTEIILSIINSNHEKSNIHYSQNNEVFHSKKTRFGFLKFIDKSVLLHKSNEFLPSNKLTILCEMKIAIDNVKTENGYFELPRSQFFSNFGTLFHNEKFSDMVICVAEQEVPAHKAILAARSPVFSAMFEHDMLEKNSNRLNIQDVKYDVLIELLRYIYTDNVQNMKTLARDLLVVADKYDLERLKIMCEIELCNKLTTENAADILNLSDMHNAKQLKSRTIDFIANNNISEITNTSGWNKMLQTNPNPITEVFLAIAAKRDSLINLPAVSL